MLMALLREETHAYHDRIEHAPLSRLLMDGELSHRFYAAILGVHYGFYAPIEARLLSSADWEALGFDLHRRLKTPLLAADLARYSLDGELLRALPVCTALPRLPDLHAALGAMYVLEGATLGGQLIARQLATTLGIGPTSGAAFFNSYCAQVGPLWRSFRAFVNQQGAGHEDAVLAAASATYAAFEAWYAESYQAIAAPRMQATLYTVIDSVAAL